MNVYTRETALDCSLKYFNNDSLAAEVFVDKYALKNEKMQILECSPEQMHHRLAKEFSRIENKYPNPLSEKEIFDLFDKFKYIIPQGSPMFGIGNPYQIVSISNCFAIDLIDSYGGICHTDERIAQISKRRGGVGLDISSLRPKGMPTKNSAFTTDGIVGIMDKFSNTSREVAQNGRRGALMITISVHHPEVLNFIKAKRDLGKITGANISVRISDDFMKAVEKDGDYEQKWPIDSRQPKITRKVKARDIWNELIKSNWRSAEPGILFWDNIIKNSPADSYSDLGFGTITTNPCGELPLAGNCGSCILLLQNLSSYVINPFTDEAKFDKDLFAKNTRIAQKLLDDMVDLEIEAVSKIINKIQKDPEPDNIKNNELSLWEEVRETCVKGRRTGLGITGLGDTIAMLNIKYGDKESFNVVEMVYSILRNEAYASSIELAKERGIFPIWNWKKEKNNEYLNRLPKHLLDEIKKYGRRNIALLTTSPAGSVSVLSQTSSGFEPIFKLEYTRRKKISSNEKTVPDFVDDRGDKWKEYKIIHPKLELFGKITGKDFKESPYFGAEAEEINFLNRVQMQAIATKYTDHAISSTINLPNKIDINTVDQIYFKAWKSGNKGLTVYRSGSRDGVLIEKNKSELNCNSVVKLDSDIPSNSRPLTITPSLAPKRPIILECDIHRSTVGKKQWLFFVGLFNKTPYEIFGGEECNFTIPYNHKTGWIKKNGKVDGVTQYNLLLDSGKSPKDKIEFNGITKHFNNYEYGAFTRAISLAIRHGVPIKYICEQITKRGVDGDLFSFQRAISRILKKYIQEGEKTNIECPVCHSIAGMVYRNGCPTCLLCGFSNCS